MSGLSICELLQTFQDAFGMSAGLYDKRLRWMIGLGASQKTICDVIHSTPEGCARCFRSDLEAAAVAEKTKQPYIYTCPFGLLSAVAPILRQGEIIGYIFVGRAISDTREQRRHVTRAAAPYVGGEHSEAAVRVLVDELEQLDATRLEALGRILAVFAEHIAANGLFPTSEKSVASVIEGYIRHHYHERITLSALSLYLHCSTVTLTESFKREYGVSIMQYVNDVRMRAAEELLIQTELSVGTVAEQCGFAGIAYFSKSFKKNHGVSPVAYRRRYAPDAK